MMNVSRNQPAKIPGIFPRSSATALMKQKTHAVHVFEYFRTLRARRLSRQLPRLDLFRAAIRIEPCQLRHLPPINLRSRETEFFFEGLLQHPDVAVFAEHQRHHDPIISRAHLAIGSTISQKFPMLPSRYVRRSPAELFRFLLKRRRLVVDVARR